MNRRKKSKNSVQLIWGGALILMGIAVFFKITKDMPRLAEMGQSLATFGLYLMGVLLIGGGLKKVVDHFRSGEDGAGQAPDENNDV